MAAVQSEGLRPKKTVQSCSDLNVYQQSYQLAMRVFEITKRFPKEEVFALSDQLRRSSRSIPANIAEGWGKRTYEKMFYRHLSDANGSCEESKTWLRFSLDCNYISKGQYLELIGQYEEVSAMLNALMKRWKTF